MCLRRSCCTARRLRSPRSLPLVCPSPFAVSSAFFCFVFCTRSVGPVTRKPVLCSAFTFFFASFFLCSRGSFVFDRVVVICSCLLCLRCVTTRVMPRGNLWEWQRVGARRVRFADDAAALRIRRGRTSQTTRAHFADDDESGASYTKEVMPTSASDSFLYVSRAVLLVAVCPGDSPSIISES